MPRAIDHLVIAARDLDALAALYRRLGFQVGARNRHPWGTENHIIQFDGAFLELIGLAEDFVEPPGERGIFSFARFIARFLAHREGVAMLAARSRDAEADRRRFAREGLGDFARFDFARKARRPSGEEVEVAFSLAFAQAPGLQDAGFFVCQHHRPENFWSPELQSHPNGARGVAGLALIASRPAEAAAFLSRFLGADGARASADGLALDADGAEIEILDARSAPARVGEASGDHRAPLAALRVLVADLARAERQLAASGVKFVRRPSDLLVCARDALAATLIFESARLSR